MPPAVSLTDLRFRWPGQSGFCLSVPHLELKRGARALLLGASGSGKSTLLSLISAIATPDAGQIVIAGTDIGALSRRQRDRFRAEHIGVIFQQFNLLPYASIRDNILLPLRFAPLRRARVADPAHEAERLALALELPANDIGRVKAGQLSVGQQQRVAVARALIGAPELIVADEPTSALDADTQTAFLDLLFAQCDAAGSTLLMVSHDERVGARFDRRILLRDIVRREVTA